MLRLPYACLKLLTRTCLSFAVPSCFACFVVLKSLIFDGLAYNQPCLVLEQLAKSLQILARNPSKDHDVSRSLVTK